MRTDKEIIHCGVSLYHQRTFCSVLYLISTSFLKKILGLNAGWVYAVVLEILVSLLDQVLQGFLAFRFSFCDQHGPAGGHHQGPWGCQHCVHQGQA